MAKQGKPQGERAISPNHPAQMSATGIGSMEVLQQIASLPKMAVVKPVAKPKATRKGKPWSEAAKAKARRTRKRNKRRASVRKVLRALRLVKR